MQSTTKRGHGYLPQIVKLLDSVWGFIQAFRDRLGLLNTHQTADCDELRLIITVLLTPSPNPDFSVDHDDGHFCLCEGNQICSHEY